MAEGKKITRSRNGCLTCKKRRRKCDEAKPFCLNCTSTGRECLGYGIKLVFDVDDKRNFSNVNFKQVNSNGNVKYGFVGRPKANLDKNEYVDNTKSSVKFTTVTGSNRKEEQDSSVSFVKPSLSDTRGTNYTQEAITPDMPCPNSLGPLTTPTEIDTSKNDIKNLLNPAATSAYISSVMNKADSNLTVRSSSSTTENDELEILDDPEQFESAFLSGIDYILDNYDNQLLAGNTPNSEIYTPINFLQLDHIELPAPSPVVPTIPHIIEDLDSNNLGTQLKKKEENHILKHFFEKVIFLLDAHPQSPWPSLMMKFGSEELAKSCFLSLSSMHLYVNNGGDEFYKKGLLHINNTMEYLIKYVKTNSTSASSNEFDVPKIISKIKLESSSNSNFKKNKNFLVILLILYVHLLFAILESGRSALARLFLKLSASIASDPLFNKRLKKIKQSQSLLCVLSWFDTVSALISPDCRLPYCNPKWFGESTDLISTDNMNGCPVGIFKIMYDLSVYRNQLMNLFHKEEISMNDLKCCYRKLLDLREKCLHYRDHVILDLQNSTFSYIERLKCAQLWSLSTLLVTYKLEVFYFNNFKTVNFTSNTSVKTSNLTEASVPQFQLYSEQTTAIVCEFLDVYQTLPSDSPIITQMVWPIFNVACFSHSVENRKRSWECLQTLYETVKMGTIKSLMEITENVWNDGFSVERILSSEGWFASGIDMLPC